MKKTGIIIGIGKYDGFFDKRKKIKGQKIVIDENTEVNSKGRGWYDITQLNRQNLVPDYTYQDIWCFHEVRIRWDKDDDTL